jgi:hypothetical protein
MAGILKQDAEEWRTLQVKELYVVHSSPNNDKVIKPRRLEWAGRDLGEAVRV